MDRIDSWDEYFMRLAYLVAQRSKDPKTRIGSVLVRQNQLIASGYNGFPKGVLDLPERYNNRELKRELVAHSEFNTIAISAGLGINTSNSILYTFGISCNSCSKALIQGGVKEIVIHKQWPNLTYSEEWVKSIELSKMMLKEANITIRVFDKVLGLKGMLDGKDIDV